MPFTKRMVILPCCDKKTYFCIRPVGGATLGTGIFAEIFNPGAFTYTNYTGTLVWAHLRFGRRIWSGKSCLWKPQLILEGWKYIWTMCRNGIGTVIAHRRNNEAARCPNAPVHSKTAHPPPGQSPGIWLTLSSVQWGIWPKMRPARWGIWLSCQNACSRTETKGFSNCSRVIPRGFFCCCRYIV